MTIYATKAGGISPNWPTGYPADSGCNSQGGKCGGTDVGITNPTSDGCGRDCGTRACVWNGSSCCNDGNQQNKKECGPALTYPNAAKMCPAIGTVSTFSYATGATSIPTGSARAGVKITCNYISITDDASTAWSDSVMGANFDGSNTSGTIQTIRANIANTKTFSQLYGGTVYQNFYSAQGGDRLNNEYLIRINREKPNTWPDDPGMRSVLLSIALSTDPTTRNQTPNAISATTMISKYCLQTNPATWITNTNMVTFINNLLTNQLGPTTTNAYLQATAETIVTAFCQANPTNDACGCYNAMSLRMAGCTASTKGCAELVSLSHTFDNADPKFAPVVATIKASLVKPQCVSTACLTAVQNPASGVLRTADTMTQTCTDDVSICLESLKVGGSIAAGANITQSCKTTFNISNAPPGISPAVVINATDNPRDGLNVGVGTGNSPMVVTGNTPAGYVMVGGTAYLLSDFLITPGKSSVVDKIAPTPRSQKMALGACVLCCFCIFLLVILSAGALII